MQTQKRYSEAVSILAVLVMTMASFAVIMTDNADAASSYTVTDGKGNTVTFETVPEHVASYGAGLNATIVQIGCMDKIVAIDSYTGKSASYNYDVLKDLRQKVADGSVLASGNIYTSGRDALVADIVSLVDDKKFDLANDVVIITGSDTYLNALVPLLQNYGFQKILLWNDIYCYGDIADFVDGVSTALTGSAYAGTDSMRALPEKIASKIGSEKAEAFYVTYSGGTFKVGNTKSLANSLIIAAGGISVTIDDSKSASTYEANITAIVEEHPNAVILIDKSIYSNEAYLANFMSLIEGSNATVLELNPLWNNYSLESMDGVVAIAQTLYPDIDFSDDSDDDSDFTGFIGKIIEAILAIFQFILRIFGFAA